MAYRDEDLFNQLGAVGDQVFKAFVDREDCEHSIAAHKGVTVLKVILDGRDERLKDLSLLKLAEESKRAAADVFVRMREVVPQVVAAGSVAAAHVAEPRRWQHGACGVAAP